MLMAKEIIIWSALNQSKNTKLKTIIDSIEIYINKYIYKYLFPKYTGNHELYNNFFLELDNAWK